ncbi:hypothetical protein OBBRIDRAFT_792682 [Obba rivulosa]|uniref:Pinin/SDK/MemA protein domain-containing protein n=1 Tax=Obba rivulosa TaxID=1052685 RepID=A0A8E2AU70_9APHY|nr:hypothetical protein OBBRIDRAFT_792682 [Obba rivulosa]
MSAATEARPHSPPPTDADADTPMQDTPTNVAETPTEPAAMASKNKKRPRLDMTIETRERKRGKSMFGVIMGTLAKAKEEDRERNKSDAAKKRQLIEQRLQDKLRRETDSVRRAEEAKKDKTAANRKEEDLQLKDSIYKLRRTRLPLLANFLLTSDHIPDDPPHDSSPRSSSEDANGDTVPASSTINKAALSALIPARSHPPALFYLPAILTPAQEAFLAKRKADVTVAAATEWEAFRAERETGLEDITRLRSRVAEEEARLKERRRGGESEGGGDEAGDKSKKDGDDTAMEDKTEEPSAPEANGDAKSKAKENGKTQEGMDVDDSGAQLASDPAAQEKNDKKEPEKKEEQASAPMQADDDDAVEY